MSNEQFQAWLLELRDIFIAALIAAPFGLAILIGIYLLLPPELQERFLTLLEYT